MTEMCFEPGAAAKDVGEALRALSGRLAADTPVLALGGRHARQAGQAVFASAAMMRLFCACTLSALSEAIAKPRLAGPAAERLNHLSETLPLNGPARLERLRFDIAGRDRAITFLCRRLTVAGAPPFFVAAALDLDAALDRSGVSGASASAAPASAEADASPPEPSGAATLRFLWRTDANHRLVEIGAELMELAGADLIGHGFVEALARIDPSNGARLAQHLERRESFSGVEVVWPIAGSSAGAPIAIAGAPAFDARRRFTGFRGFGLIRIESFEAARRREAENISRPAAPLATQTGARRTPAPAARPESTRPGIEAELRHYQREARELTAILDTAMDGVAVLDAQGRIKALNRSGEALFGFDKAEVAGEAFTILIAPESRARAESYFEGLKSNGVASLLNDGREILGLTRQGGTIPLFMTLGKIGDGVAHEEARYCALLRDMTHWKTVERELDEARREAERASALKSDFLAKISHEIRTPLNAILGFAEVIMGEQFGPIGNARYKDYLKDIRNSGALVLSLVNDLLDLSKIEAGKMDLSFEAVDANAIVAECVSIMQPQASAARVVMRLSLAPQLPQICADERALRQIVLNLLSNAIKFTQGGGQVIISTALTEVNCAALRIRDTGVGMSESDVEIALQPFRQVASARSSGGTGLGLPLTKALVEANRASFSIKSKLHEGTLVEVVFPPARVVASRA
jgi:PAS domain S-box-containing protein